MTQALIPPGYLPEKTRVLLNGIISGLFSKTEPNTVTGVTTFRGRIISDPNYAAFDSFAGVEAAMFSFGSGSQTIAANKQLDLIRADNTWTIGAGGSADFCHLNLTASASCDATADLRGYVSNIISNGPLTISGGYDHVTGYGSSTGDIIAHKFLVTPGASTANAHGLQVAFDSTDRKVDIGIRFNSNAGSHGVDYLMVAGIDVVINNVAFQACGGGTGYFAKQKSPDGTVDYFYVSPVGAVFSIDTITGKELRATGDAGGAASQTSLTNAKDLTTNSTGVGTIKFKGSTSRDSVGFIKMYIGTTAYYVPVFDAISG